MNLREFWKAEADKLRDRSQISENKDKILSTSLNTGFEEILTVGKDGSVYVDGTAGSILYVFSKEKGIALTKNWCNSQAELDQDIKNHKIAWVSFFKKELDSRFSESNFKNNFIFVNYNFYNINVL